MIQPPSDENAENCLLSCLLQADAHCCQDVASITTESHFHTQANKTLWQAALSSIAEHKVAGMVDVISRLTASKELKAVGGRAHIADLLRVSKGSGEWKKWWGILEELRYRREMIKLSELMAAHAHDMRMPLGEAKEFAEKGVMALDVQMQEGGTDLKAQAMEALVEMEQIYETGKLPSGLFSGIPEFDRLLMGFRRAEMVVIAARPSEGKTSVLMQIAENLSIKEKHYGAIFSLEMSGKNLVQRQLSGMARMSQQDLAMKAGGQAGLARLCNAAGQLANANFEIIDKAPVSAAFIQGVARRLHRKRPLEYIMVDYLQLITATSKRGKDSRVLEVGEAATALKHLAKELDTRVIVLAQLNRDVEDRKNGKPKLSDLKDSGAIEQEADMVCLMSKDESSITNMGHATDFNWAKNRNGSTGLTRLWFDKRYTRFNSIKEE